MLFHIHIDAENLADEFSHYATATLGFSGFRFEPNPANIPRFAPEHPFTLKVHDEGHFHRTFDLLEAQQSPAAKMRGYIEGERVSYHKLNNLDPSRPFAADVPIPFAVSWRRLGPGIFRESELHLTIPQASRDLRLRDRLLEMGFFLAVCVELKRAPSEIYTLQGSQEHIDALRPSVVSYLERVGGLSRVVVKEEKVERWWKSVPDFPLPPVVDRITSFEAN